MSDTDYINEHMGGFDGDGLPNFMNDPGFFDDDDGSDGADENAVAMMKENKEEPAVGQISMSFAQTFEYVAEEIWNTRNPERRPQGWEEEYLTQKMLDWLSEEDKWESLQKEVGVIEEYTLPEEWNDELKPMIKFLQESLSGLGQYFNDEEEEEE